MFYCFIHKWNSKEAPCPACYQVSTISASTLPQREVFKWTDELAVLFASDIEQKKHYGKSMEKFIKEFKQSKTQPISSDKEKIKVNNIRHASVTSSVISIDFDSPVSSETFPSIKSAIEKIINNE